MITYSIITLERGLKVAFIRKEGKLWQTRVAENKEVLCKELNKEFGETKEKVYNEDKENIKKYLANKKLELDISYLSPFQQAVLKELIKLERGETSSYGNIAKRIEKPGSARAVGNAVRNNPFPPFIPCHRVIRADGNLGGFGGKQNSIVKRKLLEAEGIYTGTDERVK